MLSAVSWSGIISAGGVFASAGELAEGESGSGVSVCQLSLVKRRQGASIAMCVVLPSG